MDYTSTRFVLAALLHALPTGGTQRSSLDQPHCSSPDDFANEQLQALMEDHGRLYRFRNIQKTCPKSLNTASAIHKMKAKHLLSLPVKKG
ncbi:hypothetical protein LOK49_LG01G02341 [Camellia lanceoleosa]|uniref:Uncharacterized protein n=1 Tax=Camellia lanceoleosa TaxID=1840588 RepID=A0ACC0J543_9ERIC|nr:hypothetical protein LOK49_LG01G02341 [Camellia lanceoleosa]